MPRQTGRSHGGLGRGSRGHSRTISRGVPQKISDRDALLPGFSDLHDRGRLHPSRASSPSAGATEYNGSDTSSGFACVQTTIRRKTNRTTGYRVTPPQTIPRERDFTLPGGPGSSRPAATWLNTRPGIPAPTPDSDGEEVHGDVSPLESVLEEICQTGCVLDRWPQIDHATPRQNRK